MNKDLRQQLVAILVVIVLTAAAILFVSRSDGVSSAAQPQRQSAPDGEP